MASLTNHSGYVQFYRNKPIRLPSLGLSKNKQSLTNFIKTVLCLAETYSVDQVLDTGYENYSKNQNEKLKV